MAGCNQQPANESPPKERPSDASDSPMPDSLDLRSLSFNGIQTGDSASLKAAAGVELTHENNRLSCIFVTIAAFQGSMTADGKPLEFSVSSTPAKIIEAFGEPYWRDDDEGETILFYEYESGAVELQFEFSSPTSFDFITITRPGILADAEQRTAYGVDKEWPPAK